MNMESLNCRTLANTLQQAFSSLAEIQIRSGDSRTMAEVLTAISSVHNELVQAVENTPPPEGVMPKIPAARKRSKKPPLDVTKTPPPPHVNGAT